MIWASNGIPNLTDEPKADYPTSVIPVTPTVDYAVVLESEIWLEVDDHQTVHLRRGDIVVQNGTRHGWRNKGSQSATMLFVLHGANQ
jgi:hypothetical protein